MWQDNCRKLRYFWSGEGRKKRRWRRVLKQSNSQQKRNNESHAIYMLCGRRRKMDGRRENGGESVQIEDGMCFGLKKQRVRIERRSVNQR